MAKDHILKVRMDDSEWNRLEKVCKKYNLSKSYVTRMALDGFADYYIRKFNSAHPKEQNVYTNSCPP